MFRVPDITANSMTMGARKAKSLSDGKNRNTNFSEIVKPGRDTGIGQSAAEAGMAADSMVPGLSAFDSINGILIRLSI